MEKLKNLQNITVQYNCTGIQWNQITELFELVSWGYRAPEKIQAAFEKSSHVIFIKENDKLIGIGRTVDDSTFYGLIVDVVVHPDKQGLQLGTQIVDYLKGQMAGYNFITLTAAPGKDGFYEKLGWKKQKSAFLWPRDEKQQQLHCF